MFRFTKILSVTFFAACFAAACAKPQYLSTSENAATEKAGSATCFAISNLCVGIMWEKTPTETEFGSFVFNVSNEAGLLADPAIETNGLTIAPKVVLWMPSMGHGSSPVTVERISTGLYRAKNVFFTMKGDWEIRFQVSGDQAIRAITL